MAEGREQPAFDFSQVAKCRIHPGIGIARVGNSPDEFFIGPEAPCDPNDVKPPAGGFKDAHGRIKRQAARFRIYAYDSKGKNLGELPLAGQGGAHTAPKAQVVWRVHLANKKGAWFKFVSRFRFENEANRKPRNPFVPIPVEGMPDDRDTLVVDPGPRKISGQGEPVKNGKAPSSRHFDTGSFLGTQVPLGEIKTDEAGRLLVLGGFGKSGSTLPGNPIGSNPAPEFHDYFANNDYWYDDISDGPVTASVTLPDGTQIKIDSAADAGWVIVAPPKYAPGVYPIVTLYDVIRDTAIRANWLKDDAQVEYYRDIYPILLKAGSMSWVNDTARRGHGFDKLGDYRIWKDDGPRLRIDDNLLRSASLSTPGPDAPTRKHIFERLRNPEPATPEQAVKEATARYMPYLSGDGGDASEGKPHTWFSLLPAQYKKFEKWKDGQFVPGVPQVFPPLSEITDPDEQTRALQRGPLEPCSGGAFFPGIEMTYIATQQATFSQAFRINSRKYKAGDISKWMALPWQADFYLCQGNWWPSQRPDDVIAEEVFDEVDGAWVAGKEPVPVTEGLEGRVKWDRGLGVAMLFRRPWQNPPPDAPDVDDPTDTGRRGCDDMVRYWSELGFVVPRATASGKAMRTDERVHVETERRPYAGMDIRELFHALLNREQHIGALPKIREFVEGVLKAARDVQHTAEAFNVMENLRPFEYDEQQFEARMQDIYDDCADFAFTIGPGGKKQPYDAENEAHNPLFRTREQVIERIKQLTPFNFLDGAWLRNVHRLGPMDEVNSILFAIFNEELGDGVPAQNHANIYRDLCHSFSFYPAPVGSSAFARDPVFLDSAFESATFQLGIAEFTERYYPEVLGMTLWLEWTVLELHRIAAIVERVGLSSHFYRMHIAIDNAVNGHAAGILRAIKLYLHQVRQEGGEPAVQCQWQRIWDGYVAFGYTFALLIAQVKYVVAANKSAADPDKRLAWLEGRLMQLIVAKKPYGKHNHTRKMLGGRGINEWFDDPGGFLEALKAGIHTEPGQPARPYIVPGKPEESAFFRLLEFQGGVMYHVFSEAEIRLWQDWVWELGRKTARAAETRAEAAATEGSAEALVARSTDLGQDSARSARLRSAASDRRIALWMRLAEAQTQSVGATEALAGTAEAAVVRGADATPAITSPAKLVDTRLRSWLGWSMVRAVTHLALQAPAEVVGGKALILDTATGNGRSLPDWMQLIRDAANPAEPARALLAAIAAGPATAEATAARTANAGKALDWGLDVKVPGNDGHSVRETLEAWYEHGCPMPDIPAGRVKPLRLDSTLDEEEQHPTGIALGFGTMH
jgi:hypothetical protein